MEFLLADIIAAITLSHILAFLAVLRDNIWLNTQPTLTGSRQLKFIIGDRWSTVKPTHRHAHPNMNTLFCISHAARANCISSGKPRGVLAVVRKIYANAGILGAQRFTV